MTDDYSEIPGAANPRHEDPHETEQAALVRKGRGFVFLLELSRILGRKDLAVDEVLSRLADFAPSGMEEAGKTKARISVNGIVYGTAGFPVGAPVISCPVMVSGRSAGKVEVARVGGETGGFSIEEKDLAAELAHRISVFVEQSSRMASRRKGKAASNLLTDFFSCLLTTSPIGDLAVKALDLAKIFTESPNGFVGFLDSETGYMICPTMSTSKPQPGAGDGEHMVFKKFSGLWGFVLKSRQPLLANDPGKHPQWDGLPEGHTPIRRFLGVPAVIDGNIVGIISLANKPSDYTEPDLNAASRIADLLALAISRTRMVEALNRSNMALENRVNEKTRQFTSEMEARRRVEENLRRSKEMFQAVFDGISDPLIMLGSDLSVLMLNRAASDYYCLRSPERALGQACFRSLKGAPAPCEECKIISAVEQGHETTMERKGFRDPARHEQVAIYPIKNFATASRASIIHIRDITESKSMQRHLVQSEKLASLGYLISGIAHEINNPNNFITFNIPILKEYIQSILPVLDEHAAREEDFIAYGMGYQEFREDLFKILENIEYGSYRINNIVSNLRAFSRKKEQAEPKWINVSEVVENALAICQIKLKHTVKTLQVAVPEDLPRIKTDPDMLAQIIINLMVNAAQAADKRDSWVSLSVWLDEMDRGLLVLEVADNGCGMDEATRERIFDPFFTTRRAGEGTGLGLSMSHHLAATLGGRIEVDSVRGQGSSFRVYLHL